MSTIVETQLRQTCPFENPLEHGQDAVRILRPSVRRGEEVRRPLPFPFLEIFQDSNHVIPNGDRSVCVLGLERAFLNVSLNPYHLTADRQRLLLVVHVLPLQPEQFPAAQSGRKLHVVKLELATYLCFREEPAEVFDGHRLHLLLLTLREFASGDGIREDQVFGDRFLEGGVQHRTDIGNCFHAQPFRLVLRLLPLDPTVRQQGVEELLEVERRDLAHGQTADAGLDMEPDVAFIRFVGRSPHVRLLEGFEPGIAPVSDCHLVRDDHVNLLRFRELGNQLFLDLRLRLAEDVLEDLFARYGIVTDGVASFPATVGTLTDAAFAVRAFLWHSVHLSFPFLLPHNIPQPCPEVQPLRNFIIPDTFWLRYLRFRYSYAILTS